MRKGFRRNESAGVIMSTGTIIFITFIIGCSSSSGSHSDLWYDEVSEHRHISGPKCWQNSDGLLVKKNSIVGVCAEIWDAQISVDVYYGGGVDLVEVGQKKDFLQKSAEKTAFLRDTNRDHLTLEGHNSLNFKDFRLSQGCFGKFGT